MAVDSKTADSTSNSTTNSTSPWKELSIACIDDPFFLFFQDISYSRRESVLARGKFSLFFYIYTRIIKDICTYEYINMHGVKVYASVSLSRNNPLIEFLSSISYSIREYSYLSSKNKIR